MENKDKKTLAKIAAIFSIIAVFSIGFVDNKVYANDPKGDIQTKENIAAENALDIDNAELEEFLNAGEVSEVQDGPESPYYQAITQDHIDSAKTIYGETSDPYTKMLKAYESQEALRVEYAKAKSEGFKGEQAELIRLSNAHGLAYQDHHDAHQNKLLHMKQRVDRLEKQCQKGCSESQSKELAGYKAFSTASVKSKSSVSSNVAAAPAKVASAVPTEASSKKTVDSATSPNEAPYVYNPGVSPVDGDKSVSMDMASSKKAVDSATSPSETPYGYNPGVSPVDGGKSVSVDMASSKKAVESATSPNETPYGYNPGVSSVDGGKSVDKKIEVAADGSYLDKIKASNIAEPVDFKVIKPTIDSFELSRREKQLNAKDISDEERKNSQDYYDASKSLYETQRDLNQAIKTYNYDMEHISNYDSTPDGIADRKKIEGLMSDNAKFKDDISQVEVRFVEVLQRKYDNKQKDLEVKEEQRAAEAIAKRDQEKEMDRAELRELMAQAYNDDNEVNNLNVANFIAGHPDLKGDIADIHQEAENIAIPRKEAEISAAKLSKEKSDQEAKIQAEERFKKRAQEDFDESMKLRIDLYGKYAPVTEVITPDYMKKVSVHLGGADNNLHSLYSVTDAAYKAQVALSDAVSSYNKKIQEDKSFKGSEAAHNDREKIVDLNLKYADLAREYKVIYSEMEPTRLSKQKKAEEEFARKNHLREEKLKQEEKIRASTPAPALSPEIDDAQHTSKIEVDADGNYVVKKKHVKNADKKANRKARELGKVTMPKHDPTIDEMPANSTVTTDDAQSSGEFNKLHYLNGALSE